MGVFSWFTQDTDRSIAVEGNPAGRPAFTVFMVNPLTKEFFEESHYDGYGEFGGKDFFVLIAEMNGSKAHNPEDLRDEGIDWAYHKTDECIFPVLIEDLDNMDSCIFKSSAGTGVQPGIEPDSCPDQGYFYNDEDDDDDYPSWDDEEDDDWD